MTRQRLSHLAQLTRRGWYGLPSRLRVTYPLVAVLALTVACPDAGEPNGTFADLDANVPEFSAESAFELLKQQVAFGPRAPGLPGHAAQLEWMTELLRQQADTVILQNFTHDAGGIEIDLTNVFARFRPDLPDRVLLLAHWDTRPTADAESDPDMREQPILGANDGASGVAVLLELARIMSQEPPPIGVDLLFTDGEDYGPFSSNMYLGAKHFAANLPAGYAPYYGILLDMIGDQDPEYPIEGNSQSHAPEVVERVWSVAEQLGHGALFQRRNRGAISDDHVPLNRAGIHTIDIIDFEYGPGNMYWHTLDDVVENTSPQGLAAVGEVLTTLIYNGG